ncbi:MAG: 2-oxo acid dehydrogenase subunit E2 [Gammaproteobacteria bacterium]|nr:2-oxo acid dehydrogenase subunit E2 [Gammaproteobacteria bacterium]MDH5304522.1 2-oxo acid dehydrogenase subunit E2 [Gammaproteobacteria bacterium]MDH5322617.1 2-oxo acid dehydrogenase subunit E2 [Gammaproteobacteria bacterium]
MSEYVFKLPDLGEGMVESEIGEWFVKVGDQVAEEDVICSMMTDKAAVELSSPVAGQVLRLAGEPGDMVPVGAALITFTVGGGDQAVAGSDAGDNRPHVELPQSKQPGVEQGDRQKTRVMTSPAIRRRAKEAGIDLATVTGTGPGGRVSKQDFESYLAGNAGRPHDRLPQQGSPQEIKVIGLRRIIAERMAAATREIPHFTYVEEIDITEVEALRRHLNDKATNKSSRLTPLPFLGLALVRALAEFPQCNATYDKDRNVILRHSAIHLGIATQTPDGLKVPVVRHAEGMSLHELAEEIRRVSEAARNNSITKSELSGSTITITSLGKLGGIVSTPVINMPEVGIIGVNRAIDKPVVLRGQVAVRTMMNLSSSFDHRFVDGYDAAAMIQRIKEMLEHPATIFLP